MSLALTVNEENDKIYADDLYLIAAGVIGMDQVEQFEEAFPEDLAWLPTEEQ